MPTVGEATVDAIVWYMAGRYSTPPESIAEMTDAERTTTWNAVDRLVQSRGIDYAWLVAEAITRAGKG